jgi:hypothetical protein
VLIAGHDGSVLAGVEYYPIKLTIGPPEPGGIQAVAFANFSVTPRVVRGCTVSLGEAFVRLDPARTAQLQREANAPLATEGGSVLLTQEFRKTVTATRGVTNKLLTLSNMVGVGVGMGIESPMLPTGATIVSISGSSVTIDQPITLLAQGDSASVVVVDLMRSITNEPPPVEIGMEAIGDFIPLNAFVSSIVGGDIYLKHPDGTPVSMLYGAARTNQADTPADYLELGGTAMDVTFRKPYRIHIPFRMATGYMQLANEENVKGGDAFIDRSVTVVYTPTTGDKDVELIERFNGRVEMRPNIARRSVGGPGGFSHRQDSASTVLNTNRLASALGFATGVAKAKFAARAQTDLTAEDQHLQVELYARPEQTSPWKRSNFWIPDPRIKAEQPFVLHSVTVNGVVQDGE